MKTIPSLVASSTVGVAAAGLAFARPERSTTPRPSSKKRKAGDFAEVVVHNQGLSSSVSRPGTSATVTTPEDRTFQTPSKSPPTAPTTDQRPSNTNPDASHPSGGRRSSVIRHGDLSSPREISEEEPRRESISSRGSWIRRLSTIPNSYNNSPRSSVGPESPSINISHGSAAPILSSPANSPAQLPPNKLVKRTTSDRVVSGPPVRSGSRSQLPTLRRPATSHQRSVTLQQQFRDDSRSTQDGSVQTPSNQTHPIPPLPTNKSNTPTPESRHIWRLYFDSRPTKLTKERTSGRSSDGGLQNFHSTSTSRRVIPDETVKPTLVKPAMILASKKNSSQFYYDDSFGSDDMIEDDLDAMDEPAVATREVAETPQKRPRRSLSMHFSSPGSWISRSGSLRGNKRDTEGRGGGKRYSSAPGPSVPGRTIGSANGPPRHRLITDPTVFQRQPMSPIENQSPNDPYSTSFQARSRNSSSPLPPLSRLSSFNIDLARLGLSSSSSSAPRRSPTTPVTHTHTHTNSTSVSSTGRASPVSGIFFSANGNKAPRISEPGDRASTLIGSDNVSGDDDDMDFQSETVFDSLRSGATGSIRSHNAPLDSMFDESPPSINGHAKSKRLSIHEMLNNGTFAEGNDRIVEEDEGMSTPVKGGRSLRDRELHTPVRTSILQIDDAIPSSLPSSSLAGKDIGRLSLDDDDDDDEDWTRDDENMEAGNLSPPSSSLSSRKVSPGFRAALADVTHSGTTNGNSAPKPDRPRSHIFDWSEPSSAEKLDSMGNSPRPKTAHVKQIADGRGSRTIGRRGPSALHIRSQSVPVVPDVAGQRDHSKRTPKFGTWGLGGKGVSEDWDGDFEFETNGRGDGEDGDTEIENSGMLVPKAIKDSQANVVGHVGQIREVCLLVEDLKRLRLLAKEKGLINGPSAPLWKEAEGIIALAVPDEEDPTLSPHHSPTSVLFEQEISDDQYHESGPDGEDLAKVDVPFELLNRHGKLTGFVYDGNTVRRRSVFSPDDDIFGAGALNNPPIRDHLRPPSTSPRHSSAKTSSDVARTLMETMHQHRSSSDPILQNMAGQASNKMPFDTTSLKDLVHRASVLARTLADLVRKADGSQSPDASPKRESSPAFTRVFTPTEPMNAPKQLPRSHSNNSTLSGNNSTISGSIDTSPTRSLGQRMHMMTVV